MANNISLAARLSLDAQRWIQGLNKASGGMKGFVSGAKREMASLKSTLGSVEGKLASIGVAFGGVQILKSSAEMDKALMRTGQIANATKEQMDALRTQTFELAKATGVSTEELQKGFASLVAGGMSFDNARNSLVEMNTAMGVTHSNAEAISAAMKSAQANMGLDFSDIKEAKKFINEMATAADLGSAEVENLANIYGALGASPKTAGWDNARTMAFTEALSNSVPIDQLGTLIGTGTQLFTNKNYSDDFTKALGVKFYNKDGTPRDSLKVMEEAKARLDKTKTKEERDRLLFKATGKMDKQARDFVGLLTSGQLLEKASQFDKTLRVGADYLSGKLDDSLNNAVSQTSRLSESLKQAGDAFAQPVNDVISGATKKLLDKKENGGMELSGGQLLAGGALAVGALYGLKSVGGKVLSKFGGIGGAAAGVAEGKALEAAAGITPVFVTNMPAGGLGGGLADVGKKGMGGKALDILKKGKGLLGVGATGLAGYLGLGSVAGLGTTSVGALAGAGAYGGAALAGGVGVAGAAGYGAGTLAYNHAIAGTSVGDKIGEGIAKTLAFFGNKEAGEAVARMEKAAQFEGALKIDINASGQPVVRQNSSTNSRIPMTVNTGRASAGNAAVHNSGLPLRRW